MVTPQNNDQSITFELFYKALGFLEYPFAKWSAEQEKDRQSVLFTRASYFGPIAESFSTGAGMFLVGERGTGKTAAIYELVRTRNKDLVVLIDNFSKVPVKYTSVELYFLIISSVADRIFKAIFKNNSVLGRLSASQRLLLSYVYKEFTTPTTKGELLKRLEEIQVSKVKRFGLGFYRAIRYVLNFGATTAINLASDAVTKAVGNLAPDISESKVKEYFPDIPLRSDDSFNSLEASLCLLEELAKLSTSLRLGRVVVVLDKLDEDGRLGGDAEKIADFVRGVVTETGLHLSGDVQLVASIWSVPFAMLLKENIRTQKMLVQNFVWNDEDLIRALDNRVNVFSNNNVANFKNLVHPGVTDEFWSDSLKLANRNPRDLWHLIDNIMRSQYRLDPNSTVITADAITEGKKVFVKSFNYFEYYPRDSKARRNSMDVYAFIRHLLRLTSAEFTKNQLTERSGVSGSAANTYVGKMQSMGIITTAGQSNGNVNYVIRDPRIRYALENQIEIDFPAV